MLVTMHMLALRTRMRVLDSRSGVRPGTIAMRSLIGPNGTINACEDSNVP